MFLTWMDTRNVFSVHEICLFISEKAIFNVREPILLYFRFLVNHVVRNFQNYSSVSAGRLLVTSLLGASQKRAYAKRPVAQWKINSINNASATKIQPKIENNKNPRGRARSARPLGAPPKAALCCFQFLAGFLLLMHCLWNWFFIGPQAFLHRLFFD